MYKKITISAIITLILVLIINQLLTKDLSTYQTYDIGNNSDEIIECFDYDDTFQSNYLCVEDYINEQKVENPTDEPVVIRTRIYKTSDSSISINIQTAYIYTKVDFIPDWLDEDSNPFYISTITCKNTNSDTCSSGGMVPMGGINREEAIELFNYEIENWASEDIIYNSESEFLVFPEYNINNEKYFNLITLNENDMSAFWSEVEKGIENGEIKVVEL